MLNDSLGYHESTVICVPELPGICGSVVDVMVVVVLVVVAVEVVVAVVVVVVVVVGIVVVVVVGIVVVVVVVVVGEVTSTAVTFVLYEFITPSCIDVDNNTMSLPCDEKQCK